MLVSMDKKGIVFRVEHGAMFREMLMRALTEAKISPGDTVDFEAKSDPGSKVCQITISKDSGN